MQAFHAAAGTSSSAAPPPTTISKNTPRFISSFTNAVPFFYFHHIVDAENALLTVEVIGPNLSFTFSHHRAKGIRGTSSIGIQLERKTSGFLSLIKGEERHVLALAESGHGHGPMGDLLDAPLDSPILPNDVWARRTIHLSSLLGLKMESPFDTGNRSPDTVVISFVTGNRTTLREEMRGMFFSSHVEVKLAVYAVCAMLKEFAITTDFDNLTVTQLRKLRRVKWDDGRRPAFEIYFSRKNCPRCAKLVETLEKVTGIKIALCWKERLIKKVINKLSMKKAERGEKQLLPPSAAALDAVIDIHDEEDEDELGAPSTAGMTDDNTVDLTSEMDESLRAPIDLTGGDPMLLHNPLVFPGTRSEEEVYERVRGIEGSVQRMYNSTTLEDRHVPKPLPGTPIDDFPDRPLNTAEQALFHRRSQAWPYSSSTRHMSLDPRALLLSRSRYLETAPPTPPPKRKPSPITGDSRLPVFSKRRRLHSESMGLEMERRMRRFRYSVAPIVSETAEESSSSNDESIPYTRAVETMREKARQSLPDLESPPSPGNLERLGSSSSSSGEHRFVGRRPFSQRDRATTSHRPGLGSAGNLEGAQQIRTDDNPSPRNWPATFALTQQQITPPKTPSQAGTRLVSSDHAPESPALRVYIYGREATASPDPF